MKKGHPLIFIVEDNMAYSKIIDYHLKHNQYPNVSKFTSGEECLKHLYLRPDVIIQDYKLQGISGLNVLQRTKKLLPFTEFIFLSSQDSIEIAVNSIKYGAFDYIVKNEVALPRLLQKIDNIIKLQKLRKRNKMQKIFIISFLITVTLSALAVLMKMKYYH
jgi:DNA-binding NtrC family response regulator